MEKICNKVKVFPLVIIITFLVPLILVSLGTSGLRQHKSFSRGLHKHFIGHGQLVYLLVIFSGELQTFWTSVTPPSTVHQYGVNYGKGHTIQKRYRGPAEISGSDSTQSTPRLKPRKNPPRNGTKSVDELSVSGVAVRPTKQAAGVRRS